MIILSGYQRYKVYKIDRRSFITDKIDETYIYTTTEYNSVRNMIYEKII